MMRAVRTVALTAAGLVLLSACAGPAKDTLPIASRTSGSSVTSGTGVPTTTGVPAATCPANTPNPPDSMFGSPLIAPRVDTMSTGVYVSWQLIPSNPDCSEMVRINPTNGRVQSEHRLDGAVGNAVVANNSLWVTTTSSAGTTLLRLSPTSLTVDGQWPVGPGATNGVWGTETMAVAGGNLWISGADKLVEFSPTARSVTTTLPIPNAARSNVGADASGAVLVVGEADDNGNGELQRRDPATGAVVAEQPSIGVTAPSIAGVLDSGTWMVLPTGMQGSVAHVDNGTMVEDEQSAVPGTNAIIAMVADNLLWVVDQNSPNATTSYCADPATGQHKATLAFPHPQQDRLLAVSDKLVFFADSSAAGGPQLRTMPIPAGCA